MRNLVKRTIKTAGSLGLVLGFVLSSHGFAEGVSLRAVQDNPQAVDGKKVTVQANVDQIYGSKAMTVTDKETKDARGPGNILVICTRDLSEVAQTSEEDLRHHNRLRLTGTIRQMNLAQIQQEFGISLTSDVTKRFFQTNPAKSQPVLVLESIELI